MRRSDEIRPRSPSAERGNEEVHILPLTSDPYSPPTKHVKVCRFDGVLSENIQGKGPQRPRYCKSLENAEESI